MPKLQEGLSPTLKIYQFHGTEFELPPGRTQAVGDCPFCSTPKKWFCNSETGLWDCKVCGRKGNHLTFLKQLHESSLEATNEASREKLRRERKLLKANSILQWGISQSIVTGEWLIPGYSPGGNLRQLYRYSGPNASGKRLLLATPSYEIGPKEGHITHQLHGQSVPLVPDHVETVYLCEGPWDAVALWEVLQGARFDGVKLVPTVAVSNSILSRSCVVAVPGCNVFRAGWENVFAGKRLVILFDSDHPKGGVPAGWGGAKRLVEKLGAAESPPNLIEVLTWGPEGYDPELPSGYDVRDWLSADTGYDLSGRIDRLNELLKRVHPIPQEWLAGRKKSVSKKGGTTVDLLPCTNWKTMIQSWRKAMKWTDGLEKGLAVMLSSILSTRAVGDQLWVKIIGPAACGKSTLCEAVSINKAFVMAKSTIRGFHSGFQSDREGAEDNSLLSQLNNKTLVTKDGDTLIQSPNLGQILSEARDVYDRTSRTHYRNKMGRDYEGVSMTWILCGTASLRALDTSELGERFLDCVIMDSIDDETEDDILWRVANRAHRSLAIQSGESDENGSPSHTEPDLLNAMRLTGGYINHLRNNAQSLLASVGCSDDAKRRCIQLGKLVAYMRARPSKAQEETAEREFAARLVSQIMRLANCLAVVLGKNEVDQEVLKRASQVAYDTARGRTLEICKALYKAGELGAEVRWVALQTGHGEDKERTYLKFLKRIKAVELAPELKLKGRDGKPVGGNRPRWRLTPSLVSLFQATIYSTES